MNLWQQTHQLKWLVKRAAWPDGAAEVLVRNVAIVAGPNDPALTDFGTPFVVINQSGAEPDEEQPGLLSGRWNVVVVQGAEGQDMSQAALMGGARAGGVGSSRGRGVMELFERVASTCRLLTGADGCAAAATFVAAPAAQSVGSGKYVVAQEIGVKSLATLAAHYDPPRFLVATSSVPGQVSLTWTLPPTRWDQYPGRHHDGTRLAPIVRYQAGATAPATATAGTGVSGLTGASVSATVSGLTSGNTYSFAIFMPYTETGADAAERYSAQELSTTSTVVVA